MSTTPSKSVHGRRLRTAVLISGRGSNMMALVEAAFAADYPAEIALVVSNRPKAQGLERAAAAGIETLAIDHKNYNGREAFEAALHSALTDHNIEFICCAGFMRVLSDWFVSRWNGRMINIHPSLLPKYKGLHTHARAISAGDSTHGCSVHWVSSELDGGAVIAKEVISITQDDTPETLAQRLLPIELSLYPRVLAQIAREICA